MENILITGSTGFLGGALIKRLHCEENNNIVSLVRDLHDYNSLDLFSNHIVKGDVKDFHLLQRIISEYEINRVFHCASQAIVRSCATDPLNAYETNVMGTVKLLEAIRTVGMNNIKSINISTSDKAVAHSPSPYTEETPFRPKYTYETTKSCQDFVCQNYFYNYGLPIKIARCSNIYGPGDPNESRLIPGNIKKILSGESPVIYSDVANYVREFIYIDDVVDAFILIDQKAEAGEAFCVGGTGKIKIKELVEKIIELCGKKGIKVLYPEKPGLFKEIETQYIDSTKLQNLGWLPKVSLEKGLKETILYYSKLV